MTSVDCVACGGSGKSSRGWKCVPCGGTGFLPEGEAVKRKRRVKGHRQAGKKTNKSRKMIKKVAKRKVAKKEISKRFLKKKKG